MLETLMVEYCRTCYSLVLWFNFMFHKQVPPCHENIYAVGLREKHLCRKLCMYRQQNQVFSGENYSELSIQFSILNFELEIPKTQENPCQMPRIIYVCSEWSIPLKIFLFPDHLVKYMTPTQHLFTGHFGSFNLRHKLFFVADWVSNLIFFLLLARGAEFLRNLLMI